MVISFNSPQIDKELLVDFDGQPLNGLPEGSILDLRGGPQVGTTVMCLSLMMSAVENGDVVVYYDTGGLGDISWVTAGEDLLPGGVLVVDVRNPDEWDVFKDGILSGPAEALLGDLVIFDKFNEMARGNPDERNMVIKKIARCCNEYGITAVFVGGLWGSTTGHEWVEHQLILTLYSHIGIAVPSKGWAELCFSRVSQYPRRVNFEYNQYLREHLPETYQF